MSAPDIRHYLPIAELKWLCWPPFQCRQISALNVTNQKSTARTSKTPGRTRMINHFEVGGQTVGRLCRAMALCGSPGRDETQVAARAGGAVWRKRVKAYRA